MFLPVFVALAVAAVFYLLVPLVGAFMLRAQWRRFRLRLAEVSLAPTLRYRDLAAALAAGDRVVGRFRLYGRVEALEGSDRVWLRGEGVSALVDFARAPLYVLSPEEEGPGSLSRVPWRSVTSLAEGTTLFAGGLLVLEGGKPVFVEEPGEALVAASYDCPDAALGRRLVEGARAENEYWTPLTRLSLSLGLAVTSLLLVLVTGRTTLATVRAMSFLLGGAPVLPLLPPGLFLFLLYHGLWRRALALRASRDAYRMPLTYFPEGLERGPAALPDGGRYVARRLEPGEAPPEGALQLEALGNEDRWGSPWIFRAEDSRDPAAATIVAPGDPERLAAAASRAATFAALGSGLAMALALVMNYALGILLWQRLF